VCVCESVSFFGSAQNRRQMALGDGTHTRTASSSLFFSSRSHPANVCVCVRTSPLAVSVMLYVQQIMIMKTTLFLDSCHYTDVCVRYVTIEPDLFR
jgi:hypothetical protein